MTWPSPLTMSPGAMSRTLLPTSSDLADELVTDDERRLDRLLRPGIPVGDVQVRAADAGLADADPDVVDARSERLGDVA